MTRAAENGSDSPAAAGSTYTRNLSETKKVPVLWQLTQEQLLT